MSFTRQHTFDGQPIFLIGEKASGHPGQHEIQDFYTLRQKCLDAGTLFEDSVFPASDKSMMFSRTPDRVYEWRRPTEIVDKPQFFVEGFSRFDVEQGELGDCWFLAAVSNLTQVSKLFFRVVCDDNSFEDNYAGIFHFRFWQFGKWIDVVVDDRLPTYRGSLMYMHSTEKKEFWSALLEKAYAKLNGSYESLRGGTTIEALEDFTGGLTEMYTLKEAPPNLFHIIEKGFERNSMMGSSIEHDANVLEAETPEGLIRGHAYSITKAIMVDIVTPKMSGKIPLLRLRNPWGNEAEWKGAWSDESAEWQFIPENSKEEMGLNFDNDGEFWISFRDFLRFFERIEICNLSPESLSEEESESTKGIWNMSVFEGEWVAETSAGGCRNFLETFHRNPQYIMTLEITDDDDDGKCTVVVALMQKNRRSRRSQGVDFLTIGFAIYKLTDEQLIQKPETIDFFRTNASTARSPAFVNLREVSCRFKLAPGHYLIVPSTFDPNEEGEFLIRIFSENSHGFEENELAVGMSEIENTNRIPEEIPIESTATPERSAIEQLFTDLAGPAQEIGWRQLKQILDHSINVNRTDDTTTSNVHQLQVEASPSDTDVNRQENWLSLICGTFCKDSRFAEAFYGNQENQNIIYSKNSAQSLMSPVESVSESHGFSRDMCRSMVATFDIDYSGKLGLEEFKTLMNDIDKWTTIFKLHDRSISNKLKPSELREALSSAGYNLNSNILNSIVHRYGNEADNTIAFDDFIMCAIKLKSMIQLFNEKDYDNSNFAKFSMDEWITRALYS